MSSIPIASAEATGDEVRVPAFLHSVADYVEAARGAGLRVVRLGEERDTGDVEPRLLNLLLERPPA